MTALDNHFFEGLRRGTTVSVIHTSGDYTIRSSSAQAGLITAEAAVFDSNTDALLGYLTAYSSSERGAVRAELFGRVAPTLCKDLGSALHVIAG